MFDTEVEFDNQEPDVPINYELPVRNFLQYPEEVLGQIVVHVTLPDRGLSPDAPRLLT